MGSNVARRCGRRLGRAALVFPLLLCVGVLGSLTLAEASAGAAASHRGAPRIAESLSHPLAGTPYGAGKAFCNPWGGLSVDGRGIANVFPCADPNTADKWGTYQCADFTNRYEWATFGLTAPVDGGQIVRYLHSHYNVPIQSTGTGNLPKPGDAISLWGADTDPPGHTGVVYSVSVNSAGNGQIVYLDQNGSLSGGSSIGEDTIYVSNWSFSTHWGGYYAYNIFDWTLQASGASNGQFIAYAGNVYRIVGGAPLYVSSWAAVGGVQSFTTLTTAQFDSLSQYPANGSAVYETSGPTRGAGYVFVGGAPLPVANWKNVGSPSLIGVDPMALTNIGSGVYSHVRQYPANGTAVFESSRPSRGTGYVFAGGAPLAVTNWKNIGSPPLTGVDPAALTRYMATGAFSHVRQYPLDGTAVYEASGPSRGTGYVVAGGAPLAVTNWNNVGNPQLTGVDPAALSTYAAAGAFSHVRRFPANGTAVYNSSGPLRGAGFVFAGGAPLPVANWKNVGSPSITGVDPAALATFAATGPFSHVRAVPANGAFLRTAAGRDYRVAGGYAFRIASCKSIGGCASPTLVDAWPLTHANSHLLAKPVNGTEVRAEPSGSYWTFKNGARSRGKASSTAVKVDDTSVKGFRKA